MRLLIGGLGTLVAVVLLALAGLRVTPRPLATPPVEPVEPDTVALPADLPEPVNRFYRRLYGDRVPVIRSAVISGRGHMRVGGVSLPVRFRFVHEAGRAYRHHIQTTLYGFELLAVDERYLEGAGRLDLPFGVSEGPKVDQGANLAMWAEAVWMPAVWATDAQARWRAVDDQTALLVVPFHETNETFVVRFDPATDLLRVMESMRYKGEDEGSKTLWINEVLAWGDMNGWTLPLVATVTWFDEGTPWATLRADEVVYNADVTGYLGREGP